MEKIEIVKVDEETIVIKYENKCYEFAIEQGIKEQKEKISDFIITNGTIITCPKNDGIQLELRIIVNSKKEIIEIGNVEDKNKTENTIIYLLSIDNNNINLILEILVFMAFFGITISEEVEVEEKYEQQVKEHIFPEQHKENPQAAIDELARHENECKQKVEITQWLSPS